MKGLGGHGFGITVLLDAGYLSEGGGGLLLKLLFIGIGLCLYFHSITNGLRTYLYGLRSTSPMTPLRSMGRRYSEFGVSEHYTVISTMIAAPLYIITENINYKWIFLLPTLASLISLAIRRSSAQNSLKIWYVAVAIITSQVFLGLPYASSTYVYVEWLSHFAIHPFIIGGLCSLCLNLLLEKETIYT